MEFTPNESLVVTTLADEDNGNSDVEYGAGTSLREALAWAKVRGGSPVVTFAPGLTGVIQMLSALPQMNYAVTVQGPGAGVLTVRRPNDTAALFRVTGGVTVSVSGLTVASAGTGTGGAFTNVSGSTLNVAGCVFSGHATTSRGGAIFNSGLQCNVTDCTFTGNSASLEGGAICNFGGTLTVERCGFSGNAAQNGGAIFSTNTNTVTLRASTLNGNTATLNGGGAGTSGGAFTLGHLVVRNNSDEAAITTTGASVTINAVYVTPALKPPPSP